MYRITCVVFAVIVAGIFVACAGTGGGSKFEKEDRNRADQIEQLKAKAANETDPKKKAAIEAAISVLKGERDDAKAKHEAEEKVKREAEEKRQREQNALDAKYGSSSNAKAVAQEYVKRLLNNPATAEFDWLGLDQEAVLDDGEWVVTGECKAKNSFGVVSNLRYSCRMKSSGKTMKEVRTVVYDENGKNMAVSP